MISGPSIFIIRHMVFGILANILTTLERIAKRAHFPYIDKMVAKYVDADWYISMCAGGRLFSLRWAISDSMSL